MSTHAADFVFRKPGELLPFMQYRLGDVQVGLLPEQMLSSVRKIVDLEKSRFFQDQFEFFEHFAFNRLFCRFSRLDLTSQDVPGVGIWNRRFVIAQEQKATVQCVE